MLAFWKCKLNEKSMNRRKKYGKLNDYEINQWTNSYGTGIEAIFHFHFEPENLINKFDNYTHMWNENPALILDVVVVLFFG